MCADVCSDHSGTASLREKSIIYMILKKTGNCSLPSQLRKLQMAIEQLNLKKGLTNHL